MVSPLESGKLQLSPEEAIRYRAAADRLHEACQITVDLEMPITIDDWLFLWLADAALNGDLIDLDRIIARVQDEIQRRRKRQ